MKLRPYNNNNNNNLCLILVKTNRSTLHTVYSIQQSAISCLYGRKEMTTTTTTNAAAAAAAV